MIAFAWFMLCIWPIVGIVLFRKLDPPLALCVNFLAGYLVLPSALGIDFPVLPEFDKYSITTLVALVMTLVVAAQSRQNTYIMPGWVPREPVTLALLCLMVIGSFGTVLTNMDPLFYGPRVIPGIRIYDAFSMLLALLILVLPYLLARRLLATPEAQRTLLVVLTVSMLIYSIPAMWEVRMSPQLHRQVYGYFPHSFIQQVRGDGFRPMVFLNHGLGLAIVTAMAILAAAGLYRMSPKKTRKKWAFATVWLFIVLILAKSMGALMITVLVLPLVLLLSLRLQLMAAASIAIMVLMLPMLRAIDVVPTERIVAFSASFDPVRARSLEYRIENEDLLLAKASERPLFGWGLWNRNRVFDENGRDLAVTDGAWVIEMGVGGWVRYIAVFGLLCWPIIGLFLSGRNRIDPICSILALIMAAKLIDLIPNTGMVPVIWLIAGSLMGRLELSTNQLMQARRGDDAVSVPDQPQLAGYSRQALDPARNRGGGADRQLDPVTHSGPQYSRTANRRHVRRT